MFGYVKVYKPELKIKHYEEYRAVYCSLCKVLGKRYGLIARMTLNYDFTFLALMRMSVLENMPCFEAKRCPFNPAKKCNFCRSNTDELNFTADIAMIMTYYKIIDNIKDEKFFKRMLMKLLRPLFKRKYKKAKKLCPEGDSIISSMMEKQADIENSGTDSVDEAANPTATAMGEILKLSLPEQTGRIMYRIGYCIGRWVYITDAWFDREEDLKKRSYNPFNLKEKTEKETEEILNITIGEMISAYNLLEVRQFNGVISNVMYDGLYHSFKKEENKNERSL